MILGGNMKFLIWNKNGQFIGHTGTLQEAWTEPGAEFIAQVYNNGAVSGCWYTHTNNDGRQWYKVPVQQFACEFLRIKIVSAQKATLTALHPDEDEVIKNMFERWHWKPNQN